MRYLHRRPPGRRSGYVSSADESRRAIAQRPCHDYVARDTAAARLSTLRSHRRGGAAVPVSEDRGSIRDTTVQYAPGQVPGHCWRRGVTFCATKGLHVKYRMYYGIHCELLLNSPQTARCAHCAGTPWGRTR